MRPVLVNISRAGTAPCPALLQGGHALALHHWKETSLRQVDDMAALLRDWALHAPALEQICDAPGTAAAIAAHGVALDACRLHAPAAPGQVYCTIGNYRAQLLEAALDAGDGPAGTQAAERRAAALALIDTRRREGTPYVCMKASAAVAGPHDDLAIGGDLTTLDWEVEIGVVIGHTAWRVQRDHALDHVAGYCVVNDITLRARVFRPDLPLLGTDWLQSKGRPGWLPAGPWLTPAWNIPDPASLCLSLSLNGTVMQQGGADDMVFDIADQIAYLSQHTRLEPGDLVCTGSPAGFGSHHGRYLRPGDLIEASVTGLGTQRVRCVS
jgi:2,4-didehydro-3-deoxy-L-rhamnonate hydrolase